MNMSFFCWTSKLVFNLPLVSGCLKISKALQLVKFKPLLRACSHFGSFGVF